MNQTTQRTFRGRSLEELLPQVRAELGPEAVVLSRRDGLEGGVGGFFQRPWVEVDAEGRAPATAPAAAAAPAPAMELPAVAPARETEGLRTMLREADGFARELEAAQATPAAGLYGPQPSLADFAPAALAPEPTAPAQPVAEPQPAAFAPADFAPAAYEPAAFEPAPAAAVMDPAPVAEVELEPEVETAVEPAAPARAVPAAARTLARVLADAGLPARLVDEVVAEALHHGLAFGGARQLKSHVRAALAARIEVMGPLGTAPRTVVVAGGSGAGKTTAAQRLAAAYRGAGQVAVRELLADDPALQEPFDGLTVVDAPATRIRDTAAIAALAALVGRRGFEVHVALPATMSAAAVADVLAALEPLGPTHALLTHADETVAPGAAIARATLSALPLSYVCGDEDLRPADATELARRLV